MFQKLAALKWFQQSSDNDDVNLLHAQDLPGHRDVSGQMHAMPPSAQKYRQGVSCGLRVVYDEYVRQIYVPPAGDESSESRNPESLNKGLLEALAKPAPPQDKA